ncbi:MAG: YqjK family protein [Gammaproteobacteria bacterium]|jgi:hypothetical protein|nr:YqjK family protein [Gammaproteobacteria bacterium]
MKFLRRRRELLVSQAAAQRSEVSYVASNLQKCLWWLDMGFAIVQAVRIHPLLAVTSATLLLRAPRNKLLLWAGRLFTTWELFEAVRKQWPRRQA